MSDRLALLPAALLLALLALPVVGLLGTTSPAEALAALWLPSTGEALWLSLRTTTLAIGLAALLGTPLAWRLSRSRSPWSRALLLVVELPVVLPPAVLGLALLAAYGRQGLLGPLLAAAGWSLPFGTGAVVVAQLVVGAPLYVLTATAAFRAVDEDLLLVARTLGAGPARAFLTVAVPVAAPGLITALGLAWSRALGEFGATLMFAGNLPGRTRTLPLAIYGAMESDLGQARAIAVLLVAVTAALLVGLRALGWRSST
ncbi:MAG: molybdate ABC transporter permease subunit [Alphaproteobacteria bacterium]|nr:molybdate ABC transporter permease subunit [Alphaproteobacteria bacterium]MCB9699536.1 molybdate ABC transporter permease subunit [Alphaproteobacteria bacterium]